MTLEIKLYDKVKFNDGRTGAVLFDIGSSKWPLCIQFDGGQPSDRLAARNGIINDDLYVTEVIGKVHIVETPFEIGKTYKTNKGEDQHVVGFGLIVRAKNLTESARHLDGRTIHGFVRDELILPEPEQPEPDCSGKTVTIDGKEYRLVPVERGDG
jgi:hypothetical protein